MIGLVSQLILLGLFIAGINNLLQLTSSHQNNDSIFNNCQIEWNIPTLAILLLATLGWAIISLNAIRYTISTIDAMSYHFPMAAEWIKTGSIKTPDTIPDYGRAFPGFCESILAYLMLPIRNEHLALWSIIELPFLGLTVFATALSFRVSAYFALLISAIVTTSALVESQLNIAHNDIALATHFCLAILFLSLWNRSQRYIYCIFAGISLGMLAATKFSGIIFTPIIIGMFILSLLLKKPLPGKLRENTSIIKSLGLIIVFTLLISAPWYIRNLIEFSNPLFPAIVTIGDTVIFEGTLNKAELGAKSLGWNIVPLFDRYDYFLEAYGPAALLLFLSPLFAIAALKNKKRLSIIIPYLIILPAIFFLGFIHQPYSAPGLAFDFNLRYLISFCLLLFILAGLFLTKYFKPSYVLSLIAFACCIINLSFWTKWWHLLAVTSIILAIIYHFIPEGFFKRLRQHPRTIIYTVFIALFTFSFMTYELKTQFQYDEEYGYADARTAHGFHDIGSYIHRDISHKKIAVHGVIHAAGLKGVFPIYPLYGEHLANDVFLIDNNNTSDILEILKKNNVDYIATFPPVLRQLSEFEFVYNDSISSRLLEQYPNFLKSSLKIMAPN